MECGCGVRKFSQMWVSRHTVVTIGSLSVFFAQSVRIELALPQAAQLSLYFKGKSAVLHLCEGPD